MNQPSRLCHCGSKINYRKCCGQQPSVVTQSTRNSHVQRDVEKSRRAYTDVLKNLQYCSYPDCASNDIINAHTISEIYLKPISTVDNHLLHFRQNIDDQRRSLTGESSPSPVGIQKATVFKGFCGEHDGLFAPIDNGWEGNDLHLFLHTYRISSYNFYRAKLNYRTQLRLHGERKLEATRVNVHPEVATNFLEYLMYDIQREGLAQAQWDEIWATNDYSHLEYYLQYFDETPSLAVSMVLPSFFYFDGTQASVNIYDTPQSPNVYCTLLPLPEGGGVLAAMWHKDIRAYARPQWDSFDNIKNEIKSDVLLRLFFYMNGGTILSQAWWKGLSSMKKKRLTRISSVYQSNDDKQMSKVFDGNGKFKTHFANWQPAESVFSY